MDPTTFLGLAILGYLGFYLFISLHAAWLRRRARKHRHALRDAADHDWS